MKLLAFVGLVLFSGVYMTSRKSLNVRNKNPLNIRFSEANNWVGQTGENGGFSVFSKSAYGFRAAYKLIKNYKEVHSLTSISEIVGRWAPATENHTEQYVDFIAKKLNKFRFAPVFESEIPDLLFYMAEFEGAQGAFTIDDVNEGVALA